MSKNNTYQISHYRGQPTKNYSLINLGNGSITRPRIRNTSSWGSAIGSVIRGATNYSQMGQLQQQSFDKGYFTIIGGVLAGCLGFAGIESLVHWWCNLSDARKTEDVTEAETQQIIKIKRADSEKYRQDRETDLFFLRGKYEIQKEFGVHLGSNPTSEIPPEEVVEDFEQDDERDWWENFCENFKLPQNLPYIIRQIVAGSPKGFEVPMILHLLQSLGAICFSRVRANYVGKANAPSLQVIIEGDTGQGKGKFEDVFKALFKRIIKQDAEKLEYLDKCRDEGEEAHVIIQTAGIDISRAKLIDILADNQGVHFDMFETEISAVSRTLKNSNGGLDFEHLRKAFSNEDVYKNNKSRNGRNGMFTVFFNYAFTGTPPDVANFIKNQIDGGTANRICWSAIPRNGEVPSELVLPSEKELEAIRNQIDEWRQTYCYTNVDGEDVACPETVIDLQYVETALKSWISEQYKVAKEENCRERADVRTRIGAIAFHCGIVLHMLFGNPPARQADARDNVLALVIYLANYCMERYLYKFNNHKKVSAPNFTAHSEFLQEEIKPATELATEEKIQDIPISIVEEMTKDHVLGNMGWGTIAKKYGFYNSKGDGDRTKVKRAILEWTNRPVANAS